MSSHPKIDIPHSYRTDFTLLQQESDRSIAMITKEMNLAGKEHLIAIAERRLQEFFLNSAARFRNHVQYTKQAGKNKQRVIMQADSTLQKMNEIKTGMLK